MNQFAYPWAFVLLLLPFAVRFALPAVKGLHGDALKIPFLKDLEKISIKSGSLWQMGSASDEKHFSKFFWMLMIVWVLLVTAAARPQWVGEPIRIKNESRDILMVLDISTSMLERDFAFQGQAIDRLTAVKLVAGDFIKKRANDRIGLILFGTRAYLQAPLTFDHQSVNKILWEMDAGMAGNSTAIGDALGLALKNLKDVPNPDNKVIILLTDGENNDGSMSLAQAVKLARDAGIKAYTIGVGSPNNFFASFMGMKMSGFQQGLDEKGLKELADATKGAYFKAEDTAGLLKIYQTIDSLEPSQNDAKFVRETKELYYIPLLAAILTGFALVIALRRIS